MIEASCHCGTVRFAVETAPGEVNDCNCSICRRYGALWAYYKRAQVRSATENGPTDRACVRRYGGNINATRKRVHEAHGRVTLRPLGATVGRLYTAPSTKRLTGCFSSCQKPGTAYATP